MSVAGKAHGVSIETPRFRLVTVVGIVALAGICVLPIVFYAPFLKEPFLRDEGVYAATAQLLLDGKLPFAHAFDNKPPLVYVWYAASFLMFGETIWAPRLLAALSICLATLLLYIEARILFKQNGSALLAAGAFAICVGLPEFDLNANTEYFMLLPLVAAFLSFTLAERDRKGWLYAAAGFLMGLSIMTKEVSLFPYLVMLGVVANRVRLDDGWTGLKTREFLRPAAFLLGGCAVAGVLVVLPFLLTGAFADMYDALVVYTMSYVGAVTWPDRIIAVVKAPLYIFLLAGPLAVFSYLAVWRLIRDPEQQHRLMLVGWTVATMIGIVSAGRFYDHYYVLIFPCFGLLVPLGLEVMRDADRVSRRWIGAALAISMIPMVVLNLNIYFQATPTERHFAKYGSDGQSLWETQSEDLADWIKERTTPDDYIYNLGFQSELYFFADRQSPTRYLFDHPFGAGQEHIDRAIEDLSANPPLYIIDSAAYEPTNQFDYYAWDIRYWIGENYDYVGFIVYADVYKLKDDAPIGH
jgi:4-amino-4-deoxy-L-arabinose transferase-like glycosyltransferase